jgi:hypothetical protein
VNGFQKHGITHLSPSSINKWIGSPSAWVAEKLAGKRWPPGIAAHRGTAAELGVVRAISHPDRGLDAAVDDAIRHFRDLVALGGFTEEDRDKAETDIAKMVRGAAGELAQYGPPHLPDNGGQHLVTINCRFGPEPGDVIEFRGYLDFLFPAHGLIVDLKTTSRIPASWSVAHGIQAAIYKRGAGNYGVKFLYVSPSSVRVLDMDDPDKYLGIVKSQVARLERFLRLGDRDTLISAVPHDPSSFYWSGDEAFRVANELALM